ncbi:TPA: O-antigen polymerase [Photobacterium damselae]
MSVNHKLINGKIYFHPLFIFFIGVFFFYIFPMVSFSDYNIISIGVLLLGVISFCIGYHIVGDYKLKLINIDNINKKGLTSIIVYCFFCFVLFEFTAVGHYSDYASGYNTRGEGDIYFQLVTKIFYIAILFISSLYASDSRKKYYSVFMMFLIYNLMSPTRLHFIICLVYWLSFGVYFGYLRIKIIHMIIGLFSLPFLFSFLLIKRLTAYTGMSFFELLIELVNNVDYSYLLSISTESLETFQSYITMQNIIRDEFIVFSSGYIRLFLMFIPRSFWDSKPEPLSRVIAESYYPEAYHNGGGFVAGIFGDAYVNGGLLGIGIVWFLLGGLSKVIYNSTVMNIESYKKYTMAYLICMYMTYITYLIQVLRGFGSDQFWIYIYQSIVITLVALLLKFKFRLL